MVGDRDVVRRSRWWFGLGSCFLAAACAQREVARVDPIAFKEDRVNLLQSRDLDLLFVIDNSGSMGAEQESLKDNFFRIIQALQGQEGLPSVHIGVVSTDVGAGDACGANPNAGKFIKPTCANAPDDFLIDLDDGNGGRTRNYTGTLEEAFQCTASLGDQGCAFEQPLEAMKRVLTVGQSNGFLREDAFLGVVFITDEDDCSTRDLGMFGPGNLTSTLGPLRSFRCFEFGSECDGPQDPRVLGARTNCRVRQDSPYMYTMEPYADFLRAVKLYDEQILVASIAGPTTPVEVVAVGSGADEYRAVEFSCGTAGAEAQAIPPIRLDAFYDLVPGNVTRASICSEDLSGAVQTIADFFGDSTRGCLGTLYDSDPNTDGVQPECTVAESRPTAEGVIEETRLDECDNLADPSASSVLPCFTIMIDPQCSGGEQLAVQAHYREGEIPPATRVITRCRVP